MNRIFNTSFENSLRILILLSHATTSLTVDKITAWDFIAINGKSFGLTNVDLHGDNSFTMCEYTARRELISIAIKELVLRGLITVEETHNGFCYKINDNGKIIAEQFQTNYANEYALAIQKTASFCLEKDERQLIKFIGEKTSNKIGGN